MTGDALQAIVATVFLINLLLLFCLFGDGPLQTCDTHGFCNKMGFGVSVARYHAYHAWAPKALTLGVSCLAALQAIRLLSRRR